MASLRVSLLFLLFCLNPVVTARGGVSYPKWVSGHFQVQQQQAATDPVRPRDPWVFAAALDDRSRVVLVALHHDLWAAYDSETGELFKAWRGSLSYPDGTLDGFSRKSAATEGLVYLEGDQANPWQIMRNGVIATPEVRYQGYRVIGDQVTFRYILLTAYGQEIIVEESPEIVFSDDGRPGLQRTFHAFDIPPGFQVAIGVNLETLKHRDDVKTNGMLQREGEKTTSFAWGKTYDMKGRLMLKPDAATTLTTFFAPTIVKNLQEVSTLDALELFRNTRLYKDLGENAATNRLRRRADHDPGISVKVYGIGESIDELAELAPGQLPSAHYVAQAIDLNSRDQFGGLDFYFITQLDGFLNIAAPGTFKFRIQADDGVRMHVSDSLLIERTGTQSSTSPEEVSIYLNAGVHPFNVAHFQSTGPKQLTISWKPPWSEGYEVLSAPVLSTQHEEERRFSVGKKFVLRSFQTQALVVDRIPVSGTHPSLEIDSFELTELDGLIGGMDFLSDGRLVVATWNGAGRVDVIEGLLDDLVTPRVKNVARGLRRPMGLQTIDDEIFVLQEQELTQLIDLDGNDQIDEYRMVANDWPLSTDYNELAFGLTYQEGFFYGALAMPIDDAGAILIEDVPGRGQFARFGFDGKVKALMPGIQVANGISRDDEGKLVMADHRNPWFSDSRILIANASEMQEERLDDTNLAEPLAMGSIWLPSGLHFDAPTQPTLINTGSFEGQWMYGDLNSRQLHRFNLDNVNGAYQGAVFRFSNGLALPVSRFVPVPGRVGEWISGGMAFDVLWKSLTRPSGGLQKISMSAKKSFEMKAIHAHETGLEISFTTPIDPDKGSKLATYRLYRWPNGETHRRRGREGIEAVKVEGVHVSDDGTVVRLDVSPMTPGYVVYINLDTALASASGEPLWSNEAWYSLNSVPVSGTLPETSKADR